MGVRTTRRRIKHRRVYDCRHTFATWAIESGDVQLWYLATIMGTSVTQLEDTYARWLTRTDDKLRAAFDAYDVRGAAIWLARRRRISTASRAASTAVGRVQIGCAVVLERGSPGIGTARASNLPSPVGRTSRVKFSVSASAWYFAISVASVIVWGQFGGRCALKWLCG